MPIPAGLLKRLHPLVSAPTPPPAGPGRNYGAHMALSTAVGFLFLGGGSRTFATTDAAAAALVIALYPRFPAFTMDHRCHLQVQITTKLFLHHFGLGCGGV